MTEFIEDGGPAFPHPEIVQEILCEKGIVKGHRVCQAMSGMSLRDWFAGQALAGLCAATNHESAPDKAILAGWAYQQADAMIAAKH